MAFLETPGIVLRRSEYRDYDRIITIFSPDNGKIDAVVRGCRKPKSSLVNATEPFTTGEFQLFRKEDRYTLENCKITESYFDLRLNYDRLKHGVYWLKLLENSVMSDVPMPELFLMTTRAFAYLSYSDIPAELLTMAFEMHLMASIGYAPDMSRCIRCGSELNGPAVFNALKGGCYCGACAGSGRSISNMARRIMMKVHRTTFDKVELLIDHPEWIEAASAYRDFVNDRMQTKNWAPQLMKTE